MNNQRTMTEEIMSHQCLIISASIYALDKEITKNPLFKDVFTKTIANMSEEKHLDIPRRVVEYTRLYDKNRLNEIYDLCWNKVKDFLPDNEAYEKEYERWGI